MSAYAAIENLGYRQLTDLWRGVAFWDLLRGKKSWGDMQRRGFQTAPVDQVSKSRLTGRGPISSQEPAAEVGQVWYSPQLGARLAVGAGRAGHALDRERRAAATARPRAGFRSRLDAVERERRPGSCPRTRSRRARRCRSTAEAGQAGGRRARRDVELLAQVLADLLRAAVAAGLQVQRAERLHVRGDLRIVDALAEVRRAGPPGRSGSRGSRCRALLAALLISV